MNTATDCPLCLARGKTWNGGDPKCAFPDGADFTADNWCCATMGQLRAIAEDGSYTVYSDDHFVGVIPIPDAVDEGEDVPPATHLAIHWYKRRGRTQAAVVFQHDGVTRPLTLGLAAALVAHYQHEGLAKS